MMNAHSIAKPFFAAAVFLLTCSSCIVRAWPDSIPPDETGTVRAIFGLRFPTVQVVDALVTSGLEMTSLGPKPLTVGHFDANGAVVNGDVVVKEFIDLGTAPIDKIFLPSTNGLNSIFVTPQVPRASGICNCEGFLIPPDLFAIEQEFSAWSAPAGSKGTFFYG